MAAIDVKTVTTTTPTESALLVGMDSALGNVQKFKIGKLSLGAEKYGVALSMHSSVNVTCTTGNTFYRIVASPDVAFMENFSASSGVLTYTGTEDMEFLATLIISFTNNSNSRIVYSGVAIGGETLTTTDKHVMATLAKTASEEYNISCSIGATLSTNDTIEFMIATDNSGDIATINHLNVIVQKMF